MRYWKWNLLSGNADTNVGLEISIEPIGHEYPNPVDSVFYSLLNK